MEPSAYFTSHMAEARKDYDNEYFLDIHGKLLHMLENHNLAEISVLKILFDFGAFTFAQQQMVVAGYDSSISFAMVFTLKRAINEITIGRGAVGVGALYLWAANINEKIIKHERLVVIEYLPKARQAARDLGTHKARLDVTCLSREATDLIETDRVILVAMGKEALQTM